MRITNESDYAIRILHELSKSFVNSEKNKVFSASLLSEQTDVSLRFALKILRKLSLTGIVKSKKGASGGYYLAKNPDNLTLGEVIETIEGRINLASCTNENFECPRITHGENSCGFYSIFCSLTDDFRKQLYSVYFSDIL